MSSLSIIMKNERECYIILFIFNNLCAMNESNEKSFQTIGLKVKCTCEKNKSRKIFSSDYYIFSIICSFG